MARYLKSPKKRVVHSQEVMLQPCIMLFLQQVALAEDLNISSQFCFYSAGVSRVQGSSAQAEVNRHVDRAAVSLY